MTKKKEIIEVPVEEVENPVEVEPEKKFDLKEFGKKVLKGVLWVGLGVITFVAIGAAVGAVSDDLADSICEDGDNSGEASEGTESSDSGTSAEE